MLRVLLAVAAATVLGPAPRPAIVEKPIPFGAQRRAETATYAKRHYGVATWRLRSPHVIVEHYTATTTFGSVWNTFASDAPDPELGELPGTCAHFVIDTDGTIYQLVPLGVDLQAHGRPQLDVDRDRARRHERRGRSSTTRGSCARRSRLTLWLMSRFRISLPNVIGHAESLTSRYHRELYAPWRCQTHGDWQHADMVTYRRDLAALAKTRRRHALARGGPVKCGASGGKPRVPSRALPSEIAARGTALRLPPGKARLRGGTLVTRRYEYGPPGRSVPLSRR